MATTASHRLSPTLASDASSSATDYSTHSVVHGFSPNKISTSLRSHTNLVLTPILKNARPSPAPMDTKKKAPTTFTLGGSSDEDASSLECSYAQRSSLADGLRRPPPMPKATSFNNQVTTRVMHDASEESEAVETTDDDDDADSDDNAIEEEDSDQDWEDETNQESGPPSVEATPTFQRVESSANLASRRSLLTTMMHQDDRAHALQKAASQPSPAIRRSRSRSTTPNGPSTANSPHQDAGLEMRRTLPRSKPIIMTTSNVHPPALSPRTTRRNMLHTELTQSLRQNLLWERQQKNSTTNAVNKRVQSAANLPSLRRAMTTTDVRGLDPGFRPHLSQSTTLHQPTARNNSSYNDYFDQGLQEYHRKGW